MTQTLLEHSRDLKTLESHLLSKEMGYSAASPLARTAWKITETGGADGGRIDSEMSPMIRCILGLVAPPWRGGNERNRTAFHANRLATCILSL